jgi:hypothetical protein
MVDTVFSTEPTTEFVPSKATPEPDLGQQPQIQEIPGGAPPFVAQGAANIRSVITLAAVGAHPMDTPLNAGGSTGPANTLAGLSTGVILMSNIP